ncbi:methyltransferase domain-containing protein [Alcaligenes nematophilus]|uniref:methyltransferase domain-containing protein n=1 Tax=Alcaligenes sp. PF14 TaxID=3120297 RepID=UPI0030164C6A
MTAVDKLHHPVGSYDASRFPQAEIDRLVRQGSASWPQERELLIEGGLQAGSQVLDLGCGPGVISSLLAKEVGPEGSIVGIEIDDKLLSLCRQINRENTTFYQGSVYALEEFSDQFDFVLVRLVMQHVARPYDLLAEVMKVLRPGGTACLIDSNERLLAIHPAPPGFEHMLQETQLLQGLRGGDRFVGGKLSFYLNQSGFKNVRSNVLLLSPDHIGKAAFLDSVLSWRPQLYPEEVRAQAEARIDQMRQFCDESMVDGYNGAFVVFGTKPLS